MPESSHTAASSQFLRHWRIVTFAGLLGMTYHRCCLIGAPQTKFLVEMGADAFHFGVISGLATFTLACQLVAGALANRLRRRKPVWMALFILHRLSFLGVLAAPGLFSTPGARVWWIIGVWLVHDSFIHLGDPLWFSWMTDLVPKAGFNEHWGRRQKLITAGDIVGQVCIAFWFGRFEAQGQVVQGFILLGSFGILLGVVDIFLFSLVPEPRHQIEETLPLAKAVIEPFYNAEYRPFLLYRIYWSFATSLAAPFFQPYLIRELQYSARNVQLLLVMHGIGMAASSGFWGRLCDTYGFRPVMQFQTVCKFIVPFTYVILPSDSPASFPVFAAMFVLDGCLNSAANLSIRGFSLQCTPRRNRAMYVAAASFVSMGLAGGLAALLAGTCIKPLTTLVSCQLGAYRFSGYHVIFGVSCLLRLGGVLFVRRLHEPTGHSMGDMLSSIRCTGLFGLRSPQR